MGKSAVGFSHTVGVFALPYGSAAAFRGIADLVAKATHHGGLGTGAGAGDKPADSKGLGAAGANFHRHLIGGAADAARTHFSTRTLIFQGLTECLHGIAGAALDVRTQEPPADGDQLFDLENVIHTPHAAFYSAESLAELQDKAATEVKRALTGEEPVRLVNPEYRDAR